MTEPNKPGLGKRIKWRWLDIIAPLEARILSIIFYRNWVSRSAKKMLGRRSATGWSRRREVYPTEAAIWVRQLLLSIFVIFGPQILIGTIQPSIPCINNMFQASSNDPSWLPGIVQSAWQVLAAILGIVFVIVVFLFELARDSDYEARILPRFLRYTELLIIIIFGLMSLISMAVNSILTGNQMIPHLLLSWITVWNQIILFINIMFIIILLIRTLTFLNPSKFR